MRDHSNLVAYQKAHELVKFVYLVTGEFPKEELFGLVSQLRRASVSIPSNIVEGCARPKENDFLHFLDIAYGSCREVEYQSLLAFELGYIPQQTYKRLEQLVKETGKVLYGLIRSLRDKS